MDWQTFSNSLHHDTPPEALSLALEALWYDAKDDWEHAHQLAQQQDDRDGAWVHAYLHRKEGDLSNASYWYRRAGQPLPATPLDDEWAAIARALLAP